jgi:hypothetical protein
VQVLSQPEPEPIPQVVQHVQNNPLQTGQDQAKETTPATAKPKIKRRKMLVFGKKVSR